MTAMKKCPECGTELPAGAPPDACPKCLLKIGLGSEPEREENGTIAVASSPLNSGGLPMPGNQFGHYEIVRTLGKGGMGSVYEAHDLESGRRVALKVLTHALDSPSTRKRFLREGRLAASINHPNSVYVFGTEEIDGTPVITMELVTGGTLQERVQTLGPLPVSEAVDAMLQVIDGLETAQAIGILHRDIKPANCFVDTDGTVKVGDFGLSISTAAREETDLTNPGTFMGTPAFSSPEQLRGEELSIRSDIYSVGVTFYYLLTGRTPFQSDNLVQLLATVLEKRAESPAKWRCEIPRGLCQLVLRCLEKQASERFKNYAELRKALLPYNSSAATPATLGLRFVAGCVDLVFLSVLCTSLVLFQYWGTAARPEVYNKLRFFLKYLSTYQVMLFLFYFGVLEGIWGATLGKAICGLCVVGSNRTFPGVPRALLRTVIFQGLPALVVWLFGFNLFFSPSSFVTPSGLQLVAASMFSYYLMSALLFSTARRKNSFAGIHDLLSNTRVILKSAYQTRPPVKTLDEKRVFPETTPQIGPYHILEVLKKTDSEEILLGYDTRLLRKVWLRKLRVEAPPVPVHLRDLARAARLRWLNGRRSPAESWDTYEAVAGQPLMKLVNERQPWSDVRFWLLDLAEEINAGLKDQSLPAVLELNRVWITVDGHAKLLDFPAPGIEGHHALSQCRATVENPPTYAGDCNPQHFLSQVAVAALEGCADRVANPRPSVVTVPLPVHARNFLTELQAGLTPNLIVERLKPLLNKAAFVSRRLRLGLIALCSAYPLVVIVGIMFYSSMEKQMLKINPGIPILGVCLSELQQLRNANPNDAEASHRREALEVYIAGHFGKGIAHSAHWKTFAFNFITPNQLTLAETVVTAHSDPSETEFNQATFTVHSFLGEKLASDQIAKVVSEAEISGPKDLLLLIAINLILWVAVPTMIAALLFRGGLILRILGVAVVRKDGMRASRLRIFLRSLVISFPFLLLFVLWCLGSARFYHFVWARVPLTCILIPLLIGMVCFALLSRQSLQDRLAGTWLVPR